MPGMSLNKNNQWGHGDFQITLIEAIQQTTNHYR